MIMSGNLDSEMMKPTFNDALAREVGIEPAVMIEILRNLILEMEEGSVELMNGVYWLVSSPKRLQRLLPGSNLERIGRSLNTLNDIGAIRVQHYKGSGKNKTKMYSVVEDYSC